MSTRQLLSSLVGSSLWIATVGCNALVGNEAVQYQPEVADKPTEQPAASPVTKCSSNRHTQALNGDGGSPGSLRPQCAYVSIDETPCEVDLARVGLDLGLAGHGWSVSARLAGCFGGAILEVSGVDDAPYPQTALQPFLSGPSVLLITNEDATDDAGRGSGAFESYPAGWSTIEDGPSRGEGARTIGPVWGSARVVAGDGAARTVTFDFAF